MRRESDRERWRQWCRDENDRKMRVVFFKSADAVCMRQYNVSFYGKKKTREKKYLFPFEKKKKDYILNAKISYHKSFLFIIHIRTKNRETLSILLIQKVSSSTLYKSCVGFVPGLSWLVLRSEVGSALAWMQYTSLVCMPPPHKPVWLERRRSCWLSNMSTRHSAHSVVLQV